jgi:hypothetical protein
MSGCSFLKRKEGGGGSDYDWGYDYRLLKKPRYFTKQGMLAKAPTLTGAPGLILLLSGPPDKLPGGDMVLTFVTFLMVTLLTFQTLEG